MNKLIGDYIKELGFGEEAGRLYGVLVEKGPLTILEASRATEIERTAIYRLIDELTARGLIEEVLEHKSRRLQAVSPEKIRDLLDNEKRKVEKLESEFPEFERLISSLPQNNSTQVRYYRGTAGIKQILWNETKAKNGLIGYTYRNLQEVVGHKYFEEYAKDLKVDRSKVTLSIEDEEPIVTIQEPAKEEVVEAAPAEGEVAAEGAETKPADAEAKADAKPEAK